MTKYVIPKKFHQNLYIFEGGLQHYHIYNKSLTIITNLVDYYEPSIDIRLPDYMDTVKIFFKNFRYLKLNTSYVIESDHYNNIIELGEYRDGNELLDYGGVLYWLGSLDVPTSWILEVVCEDIELEF
ncbi:hypothetical protein [Psychrobacter phenylpyruvicus]|uniref:Uncharacterized protein n=2 Tax=Psychrobacter phenylpyruvicus TaxID=29432 RepID=A0A379LKJ4_9GAMM|nr:hypothetical protein [Psychrobacter phenylpyruvicus]SUD90625.1 Uncharacterised protein [Psychrobacter phenylpyruvicus]